MLQTTDNINLFRKKKMGKCPSFLFVCLISDYAATQKARARSGQLLI
jgi:hypothetical protein